MLLLILLLITIIPALRLLNHVILTKQIRNFYAFLQQKFFKIFVVYLICVIIIGLWVQLYSSSFFAEYSIDFSAIFGNFIGEKKAGETRYNLLYDYWVIPPINERNLNMVAGDVLNAEKHLAIMGKYWDIRGEQIVSSWFSPILEGAKYCWHSDYNVVRLAGQGLWKYKYQIAIGLGIGAVTYFGFKFVLDNAFINISMESSQDLSITEAIPFNLVNYPKLIGLPLDTAFNAKYKILQCPAILEFMDIRPTVAHLIDSLTIVPNCTILGFTGLVTGVVAATGAATIADGMVAVTGATATFTSAIDSQLLFTITEYFTPWPLDDSQQIILINNVFIYLDSLIRPILSEIHLTSLAHFFEYVGSKPYSTEAVQEQLQLLADALYKIYMES